MVLISILEGGTWCVSGINCIITRVVLSLQSSFSLVSDAGVARRIWATHLRVRHQFIVGPAQDVLAGNIGSNKKMKCLRSMGAFSLLCRALMNERKRERERERERERSLKSKSKVQRAMISSVEAAVQQMLIP